MRDERRPWTAVAASVVAFAAYISVRYLPRGRLGAGFDRLAYTGPHHELAFDAFRAFRLPQWNSYIFGGSPLLANPQVGAFYPPKYVVAWLPAQRGVTVLVALHLALLGLGAVVLFGPVLRLRWQAVLVGSWGVVGSGVAISQIPHYEQITTIAWAPWLLASLDLLLQRRVRVGVGVAATGAVVALMLLCGHQQPAYYVLLLASGWILGRSLDRWDWRAAVGALVGIAAGFGLAALQLLPTLELVDRSVRAGGLGLRAVDVPEYTLAPDRVLVGVLGDPLSPSPPVGTEAFAGIGVVLLFLALVGLVVRFRSRGARWHTVGLLGGVGVGLLFAMGAETPVYRVAFGILPGLDLFRVPGRAILIFDLAAVVLAAIGLDALVRAPRRTDVGRAAAVLGVIAVMAIAWPFTFVGGRTVLLWGLLAGAFVVAAVLAADRDRLDRRTSATVALALVAIPLIELLLAGYQPTPEQPLPSTEATGTLPPFVRAEGGRVLFAGIDEIGNQAYLRVSLRPNVNATEGVRSIDGYDGGASLTARWTESMEAISGQPFNPDLTLKSQLAQPVEPWLGTRYGVRWVAVDGRATDPTVLLPGWRGPVRRDGPLQLFENPEYRGEATVYGRSSRDDGSPLYEQLDDLPDAPSTAIVEAVEPLACTADCAPLPATLRRPRPERLEVGLPADAQGVLVVAEGWDPGWSVEVDGKERPVRIAERNFLAVEVGPDDREVRFRYRTPGLLTGSVISVATALLLGAGVLVPWVRRRSGRLRSPEHDVAS